MKENDFHGAFEAWKINLIAVYVLKESILMEMAAKIEQVKPAFFFPPSSGTFQYASYSFP
jgi:hypothetical protein